MISKSSAKSTIAMAFLAVVSLVLFAPAVAASTTTISVHTNHTSYSGVSTINVAGQVSPVPATGSMVKVIIKNSAGIVIAQTTAPVGTGGLYTTSFTTGGAQWMTGKYTVVASIVVGGVHASAHTAIHYTA